MSDLVRAENLLREAASEIAMLRRSNEILAARVETMDLLGAFLRAQMPHGGGGVMSPDVVWSINQFLARETKP